jgi:hypothetical protein
VTVVVEAGGWQVTAAINPLRTLVTCSDRPPFSVPVPRQTVADAVIAELRSLGRDKYLRETMAALASPEN